MEQLLLWRLVVVLQVTIWLFSGQWQLHTIVIVVVVGAVAAGKDLPVAWRGLYIEGILQELITIRWLAGGASSGIVVVVIDAIIIPIAPISPAIVPGSVVVVQRIHDVLRGFQRIREVLLQWLLGRLLRKLLLLLLLLRKLLSSVVVVVVQGLLLLLLVRILGILWPIVGLLWLLLKHLAGIDRLLLLMRMLLLLLLRGWQM